MIVSLLVDYQISNGVCVSCVWQVEFQRLMKENSRQRRLSLEMLILLLNCILIKDNIITHVRIWLKYLMLKSFFNVLRLNLRKNSSCNQETISSANLKDMLSSMSLYCGENQKWLLNFNSNKGFLNLARPLTTHVCSVTSQTTEGAVEDYSQSRTCLRSSRTEGVQFILGPNSCFIF